MASLSDDGYWDLPPVQSDNQLSLLSYLTTVTLQDQMDYYEWELDRKTSLTYSTHQFYNILIPNSPTVPWFKAVWIK
ncbi:hypothetical protein F2Q69_00021961 [Brassica cretica]|uniref:Uncharacterized protein n=1 Tax=Brassica cretica TaxID=69181 RepID=A0A8S9QCB1_BRACR|nr:hypothetical protein F2Q69_00021961 [Brassica cretica]